MERSKIFVQDPDGVYKRCDICEGLFTRPEWEDRHWPRGEDGFQEAHASCCPECKE